MNAIKFSICKDPNDPIEPFNAALAGFNQARRKPVELHAIPWANYKQEIAAMAIHGHDADVSLVGAPMVNDLVAMDSLRPFTKRENDAFGGVDAFAPVVWNKSAGADSADPVYAVPWSVDPRAIVFWRDIFEDAGIDPATAFTSFENMERAFERLQKHGVATPWAVGTADKLNAFQVACTWIWGFGGEIGRENEFLFDSAEVIAGLIRYFELYRFMPGAGQNPDAREIGELLRQRKVAAIMSSPASIAFRATSPEISAKLGVALAPGPTYVGGSSLIVWRNTRQPDEAVALVRHLTTHEVQLEYARQTGFLPARSSTLNDAYFLADPHLGVFVQSVAQGRTYADLRLSGLIENMLSDAISYVWREIVADPRTDVKSALLNELEPTIRRISLWAK